MLIYEGKVSLGYVVKIIATIYAEKCGIWYEQANYDSKILTVYS